MDGWTDGWMDGWTNGQMDGQTDGRTDRWMEVESDDVHVYSSGCHTLSCQMEIFTL